MSLRPLLYPHKDIMGLIYIFLNIVFIQKSFKLLQNREVTGTRGWQSLVTIEHQDLLISSMWKSYIYIYKCPGSHICLLMLWDEFCLGFFLFFGLPCGLARPVKYIYIYMYIYICIYKKYIYIYIFIYIYKNILVAWKGHKKDQKIIKSKAKSISKHQKTDMAARSLLYIKEY